MTLMHELPLFGGFLICIFSSLLVSRLIESSLDIRTKTMFKDIIKFTFHFIATSQRAYLHCRKFSIPSAMKGLQNMHVFSCNGLSVGRPSSPVGVLYTPSLWCRSQENFASTLPNRTHPRHSPADAVSSFNFE